MSSLSQGLHLKVAQKQILTPGLVQMVTVLQLNRLELKEMINQEINSNPLLEESADGEEISADELAQLLEVERVDGGPGADKGMLDALNEPVAEPVDGQIATDPMDLAVAPDAALTESPTSDPFDEIDFGSFFDDYLDPGYKSPAAESIEKPSFETFLSQPVTLPDHLRTQLSVLLLVRQRARRGRVDHRQPG